MSRKIGKTLLISALISILLISSQTLFVTSQIIINPDPLPEDILDALRSFHRAFNQQNSVGVLNTFIADADPFGPPTLRLEGNVFNGRNDIAQGLTDFFAAHPGATLQEICLVEWVADLDAGEAVVTLLSMGVTDGMTVELEEAFYLVRRGDWRIVVADIIDGEEEFECLIPLFLENPVGGLTASTNKLAVVAPYLVILGLIAGISAIVTVKMKRKD